MSVVHVLWLLVIALIDYCSSFLPNSDCRIYSPSFLYRRTCFVTSIGIRRSCKLHSSFSQLDSNPARNGTRIHVPQLGSENPLKLSFNSQSSQNESSNAIFDRSSSSILSFHPGGSSNLSFKFPEKQSSDQVDLPSLVFNNGSGNVPNHQFAPPNSMESTKIAQFISSNSSSLHQSSSGKVREITLEYGTSVEGVIMSIHRSGAFLDVKQSHNMFISFADMNICDTKRIESCYHDHPEDPLIVEAVELNKTNGLILGKYLMHKYGCRNVSEVLDKADGAIFWANVKYAAHGGYYMDIPQYNAVGFAAMSRFPIDIDVMSILPGTSFPVRVVSGDAEMEKLDLLIVGEEDGQKVKNETIAQFVHMDINHWLTAKIEKVLLGGLQLRVADSDTLGILRFEDIPVSVVDDLRSAIQYDPSLAWGCSPHSSIQELFQPGDIVKVRGKKELLKLFQIEFTMLSLNEEEEATVKPKKKTKLHNIHNDDNTIMQKYKGLQRFIVKKKGVDEIQTIFGYPQQQVYCPKNRVIWWRNGHISKYWPFSTREAPAARAKSSTLLDRQLQENFGMIAPSDADWMTSSNNQTSSETDFDDVNNIDGPEILFPGESEKFVRGYWKRLLIEEKAKDEELAEAAKAADMEEMEKKMSKIQALQDEIEGTFGFGYSSCSVRLGDMLDPSDLPEDYRNATIHFQQEWEDEMSRRRNLFRNSTAKQIEEEEELLKELQHIPPSTGKGVRNSGIIKRKIGPKKT